MLTVTECFYPKMNVANVIMNTQTVNFSRIHLKLYCCLLDMI